jgi:hypothetical protein
LAVGGTPNALTVADLHNLPKKEAKKIADCRNFQMIFNVPVVISRVLTLVNGGRAVLTTIFFGTCVAVQGTFVERLANGLVTVRVGDSLYTGRPANPAFAA